VTNTNDTETSETVVEQTIKISARPETVWKYWTDPQRVCAWWGSAAELDPRPGGICRIEMDGGRVMRGEYLELVPHERLVFSFGWESAGGAPALAPGESRVEITMVEADGDTIMTLRHTGIPVAFAGLHAAGWSRFLPLLIAAVDGGRHL
jgi:uncharacterized protein YndB with AHSA1/START domain